MATLESPSIPGSIAATVAIADVAACPSCGAAMSGDFCPACGEKRLVEEHFSLRHFFHEVGEEVLDVDSRALRSLRTLLFSPGTLTLEYLRGRRRPYLGPLRMFLAVFALTLFVAAFVPADPTTRQQHDAIAARFQQALHALAVHRGTSDAAARDALVAVSTQHESWIGIAIPLLFAVVLYACFRRRRRWYGEHLVFATHFATFESVVALAVILSVLVQPGRVALFAVACVTYLAMLAYLAVAVRRVYGGGKAAAAGWALALFVGFGIVQGLVQLVALCTAFVRLRWF